MAPHRAQCRPAAACARRGCRRWEALRTRTRAEMSLHLVVHVLVAKLTDGRVRLAGLRVGGVVDAGDADSERDREGRLLRSHLHLVEDDALEVALGLGGAVEVDELLLRT